MTRPRPANAGAITRTLGNAGLPIGREHKAARGMVRGGWSNFTEGVTSTQGANRTRERHSNGRHVWWTTYSEPTGYVYVDYQASDWQNRNLDRVEFGRVKHEALTKAGEVLRGKGYDVETVIGMDQNGYITRLNVCRKDDDGEVVKW